MSEALLRQVESAIDAVLVILTLRGFPVVVRLSGAASCPTSHRLLAIGAYTLVGSFALWHANYDVIAMMATYAYLAVATCIVYLLSQRVKSRIAKFAISALLFMLVPAPVMPSLRVTVLVLGWEFMLASYSYSVSAPKPRSLGECAAFVLVNPALVYGRRGVDEGTVRLDARGLARLLQGAGLMFLAEIVPFLVRFQPRGGPQVLSGALSLIRIYATHTGLASVQIGLCRQIGMKLPERYERPFGASSPKEFWRRWNTYVGGWIRLYVFQPLAMYGRRRLRLDGPSLSLFSVLASFAAVGMLHDMYSSLLAHRVRLTWALWFAANGVILLAWEAAKHRTRRARIPRFWSAVATRALVVLVAFLMSLAI